MTQPTPMRTGAYVHEIQAFLAQLEQLCNSYRIGFLVTRVPMVPMGQGERQVCALADGFSVRFALTHDEPSTQEPV